MTLNLAYSYCTGLSKNEEIAIDKQVCRNREAIYIVVRNLILKVKIVVIFTFPISQPLAPCAAVMLPSPTSISRLQYIDKSRIKTTENCLRTAPVIRPRVDKVLLIDKRIEKLDTIFSQFKNGSITMEETILQLRGGDGLLDLAGLIAFTIFMHWYEGVSGVDAAFIAPPLPHMDRLGWFSGPRSRRVQRDALHIMELMGTVSRDENGFVMDYDAAYNLIKERYSWTMPVTENLYISAWQVFKHIYHGIGLGVDPENFDVSQKQLNLIHKEKGGLVAYVQRGHKLPSLEHIIAVQKKVIDICNNSSTGRRDDSEYYSITGTTRTTVFYNTETQHLILFNQTSGDLITGDKRRDKPFYQFLEKNTLGSKKWINKWSK